MSNETQPPYTLEQFNQLVKLIEDKIPKDRHFLFVVFDAEYTSKRQVGACTFHHAFTASREDLIKQLRVFAEFIENMTV